MNIILDTNILIADYGLKSDKIIRLLDYSKKTGSSIVIPQIVFQELLSNYKRALRGCLLCIEKAEAELSKLLLQEVKSQICVNVELAGARYEEFVKTQLNQFCLEELFSKNEYLSEITKRNLERIKPASLKGQEFRDTLLWLTILDYLKYNNRESNIFISNNVNDFANVEKNDLHPQLKKEVQGVNSNLTYYNILNNFLQVHETKISFVTEEWLNKNIDWALLNKRAIEATLSINCAYYFQYYSWHVETDQNCDNYELLNASFYKKIDRFWVYETAAEDKLGLELHLYGKARVMFKTENGDKFFKSPRFHTLFTMNIINGKTTDYQPEFYEEEIGFEL
jgi:predicted nucleic acid-binding protein